MNHFRSEEWSVLEDKFDVATLDRSESVMAQGNGYLGIRAVTEEAYLSEIRNCFVAGTFNRFDENEVTELPNAADITKMELMIDGERFSLVTGHIEEFRKSLCFKNGELHRHIQWRAPSGKGYLLDFYRMVSMERLHVIVQKVCITPLGIKKGSEQQYRGGEPVLVQMTTGIDGRMSNSGSQHFSDGTKRFYEKRYMQLLQKTTQSEIDFVYNTVVNLSGIEAMDAPEGVMERRRICCHYKAEVEYGQTLVIEKISNIYTTRDMDLEDTRIEFIQKMSLHALKETEKMGYDRLLAESANSWKEKIWKQAPIQIQTKKEFDQLAIHFAQYHLAVMTPTHDNRMSIGAKGLSGEGYHGHSFWDTEIFIVPYYTFTMPKVARRLLEYRYLSLPGARKKAQEMGYRGAMYPWESAWLDDGEVTPLWGVANVLTGERTRILSGTKEQHITADVAYAVWQYYEATDDRDFMEHYGYEIIFETAVFWASRLEYNIEDGYYHLNDVIGPDEYKECVDDNAFTNYMAYWNIRKAMECYQYLKEEKMELFLMLDEQIDLSKNNSYHIWQDKSSHMYLPMPNRKNVIPQDSTYLQYPDMDLTKYKQQKEIGSILKDYSIDQISHMQVSKQADILMTFFLLEKMFSKETKEANWKYYEARTLHDSSLSLSTHCVLACDSRNEKLAYELFEQACSIDLDAAEHALKEGIHAAAIGGIWQCVVYGFGGVRLVDGALRIEPFLPMEWESLEFQLTWQEQQLRIYVNHDGFCVKNLTGTKKISFFCEDRMYLLQGQDSLNCTQHKE